MKGEKDKRINKKPKKKHEKHIHTHICTHTHKHRHTCTHIYGHTHTHKQNIHESTKSETVIDNQETSKAKIKNPRQSIMKQKKSPKIPLSLF